MGGGERNISPVDVRSTQIGNTNAYNRQQEYTSNAIVYNYLQQYIIYYRILL